MINAFLLLLSLSNGALAATADQHALKFSGLAIEITQSANVGGQRDGRIAIKRGTHTIAEKTFEKMQALGGANGFFLPRKQPRQDLFFVAKEGDYDERLLAITKNGEILNLPLGEAYVESGKLYSVRTSEASGDAYAVIDLKSMKVGEQGTVLPKAIAKRLKKLKPLFPVFFEGWKELSP